MGSRLRLGGDGFRELAITRHLRKSTIGGSADWGFEPLSNSVQLLWSGPFTSLGLAHPGWKGRWWSFQSMWLLDFTRRGWENWWYGSQSELMSELWANSLATFCDERTQSAVVGRCASAVGHPGAPQRGHRSPWFPLRCAAELRLGYRDRGEKSPGIKQQSSSFSSVDHRVPVSRSTGTAEGRGRESLASSEVSAPRMWLQASSIHFWITKEPLSGTLVG